MRFVLGVMCVVFGSLAMGLFIATGKPETTIGFAIPGAVLFLVAILFHCLTVRVSDGAIRLSFGIGLIGKSFAISGIESTKVTQSRWYNGWGIKMIKGGWLFNVSGFGAVELNMKNGKRYMIGSDEPDRLHEAIEAAMAGC